MSRKRLPTLILENHPLSFKKTLKNNGRSWESAPVAVNDHDFKTDSLGPAIPWGLYETPGNRGHVFVGTSHDTPAFAVTALARWWSTEGRRRYPKAQRLLILADSGGSNGYRSRVFKYELQTRFCDRFDVKVTICHYPPGTSKWNPIEHRLFGEISKNWAGQPLESYETMLKFIRTTKTKTGLVVKASLLRGDYPTGVKVSASQMDAVRLRRHRMLPMWNYTLLPASSKTVK